MRSNVYLTKNDFEAQNKELDVRLLFSEDISVLGSEAKIGNKTVPNRLVCQAMEGCDGKADGSPDTLTRRRYDRLAKGGAGMIWFEATAVLEQARANPRQLYINEKNLDSFKKQVEDIKQIAFKENGYEPIVIMQATHSGRYSKPNGTPEPFIAYNNPIFEKDNPISSSRIVTDEYLDRVGEALVDGAFLAQKAGFDGVDIKCCHRYLNSELLSAFNRKGRYGGSLENRTRLLRESIKGAIEVCSKDFLVSSRLNVYDGFPYPYGFGVSPEKGLEVDITEPDWLIKKLYGYGVKLLNITMGNPYFNPHVNRPYAQGGYEPPEPPLKGVTRMLNTTAELKKLNPQFIKENCFDFAGFGRTIFAYPDFANDIIKKGSMDKNKICLCCSKCTEIMRESGGTPGCVIRDKEVYLPIYKELCGGKI